MHNRVLFRVPSDLADWTTLVEWPREIVCVWRATSNRSWWVLSEVIRTKRVKCLVSNLTQSAFCPSSYYFRGCTSCLTLSPGIPLMRGIKMFVLNLALWLSGPFTVSLMTHLHGAALHSCFVFPSPPLLTHITQYFVHTDWEQIAQWNVCVRAGKAIGAVWKSKVRVQESCNSGARADKWEGRRIRERFLWMSSVISMVPCRVESVHPQT